MEQLPGNEPDYFTLENYDTTARVVSVYDGDTLTIVIKYKGNFYKFNARISGIDCCELTSKNEKLKELAFNARNAIVEYFGKADTSSKKTIEKFFEQHCSTINVKCGKFDKYGRLLIQCSLAEYLINLKLA